MFHWNPPFFFWVNKEKKIEGKKIKLSSEKKLFPSPFSGNG
jgi:hypothetical protein